MSRRDSTTVHVCASGHASGDQVAFSSHNLLFYGQEVHLIVPLVVIKAISLAEGQYVSDNEENT